MPRPLRDRFHPSPYCGHRCARVSGVFHIPKFAFLFSYEDPSHG
jgi:hypothetical protein